MEREGGKSVRMKTGVSEVIRIGKLTITQHDRSIGLIVTSNSQPIWKDCVFVWLEKLKSLRSPQHGLALGLVALIIFCNKWLISIAFLYFFFFLYIYRWWWYDILITVGLTKQHSILHRQSHAICQLSPIPCICYLLFAFSPPNLLYPYTWQLTRGGQTSLKITTLLTLLDFRCGSTFTMVNIRPLRIEPKLMETH